MIVLWLVIGLVAGAALGAWLARRRTLATAPVPAPPRRITQLVQLPSLSSHVIAELETGVVVVDGSDRAVLVNPAARGMDVVDVDQLSFEPLLAMARRARTADAPVSANVDLPIGRLGREPIALAVTAVALRDETGAGVGSSGDVGGTDEQAVALLLQDVSEQRRLEAVRRDFVANVSHELKTPVGAMTLLAEAIADAADDPETVAHFAERMQREGRRLTKLVQELMELSRVQGIDPMPGAAEVKVESVVGDAVDRVRMAAEQSGIELQVSCADGLLVRGNEAQLAMAVGNLVENAVAYSGGTSGSSKVTVAAVAAADHQARPVVDISVVDQGIGIDEADLERIFERFYRVDPARSRATGGTGLGLAIVRNIVTNHLGSVSVRSVKGQGSTFTIRLPRVHTDRRSSTPEPTVAKGRP